jgi:hypothetical protein
LGSKARRGFFLQRLSQGLQRGLTFFPLRSFLSLYQIAEVSGLVLRWIVCKIQSPQSGRRRRRGWTSIKNWAIEQKIL